MEIQSPAERCPNDKALLGALSTTNYHSKGKVDDTIPLDPPRSDPETWDNLPIIYVPTFTSLRPPDLEGQTVELGSPHPHPSPATSPAP